MPGKVASMNAAAGTSAITPAMAKTRTAAARGTTSTSASSRSAVAASAKASNPSTSTSRTTSARTTARSAATTSSASSSRSTTASGASSSTRATSSSATSSRAPTLATRSAPTVTKAITTTSRTARSKETAPASATKVAAAASSSRSVTTDETWTEAQAIEALANPKTCPIALPHYVLLRLGTTPQALHLDSELGGCPTFSSSPDTLSVARSVYFAKQLVNAGLAFLSPLAASGWSSSSAESSSEVAQVTAAVNVFRTAARFLLLPRDATSTKQKELEVETVVLRTCTKLKTLGLAQAALSDCEHLGRLVVSSSCDTDADAIKSTILLPQLPRSSGTTPDASPARISFLVDLQCSSVTHALETADLDTLDSILVDLNHENGPLAWQLHARQSGRSVEVRVLDRVAFATERAISRALQRLEAPNNQEHLAIRALALQLLVQVSDIDLSAFWERVARTGGAVLKSAQKDGADLAAAYCAVQDAFEIIVATAARGAEETGRHNKLQGDGHQRFCEYWLSFARKAGSAIGVERATAAMSGAAPTSQSTSAKQCNPSLSSDEDLPDCDTDASAPQQADLSDREIARICAILTGSVLALDKVLAGTSEADTQHKVDDAARILQQQVAKWPHTATMASQLKLYRVLGQLHRRCCSKLSSQGSDSKGQPKKDPTAPANVDGLTRACLQLLHDLFKHTQTGAISSTTSAGSTPTQTNTLPTKDACLTDIVYAHRVLANKCFSISSRSARDEALGEMQKCHQLLQGDSAQSLPTSVISEQLRLLSTSFYNPAGILYNAANYIEAAVFLQLSVDSDQESIKLLESSCSDQQELETTLPTRREALNKKLEYTAVAYRFAGDKAKALQTYRQLLLSASPAVQQQLRQRAGHSSVDDCFRASELKSFANWIKTIVDLSVHELSFDMDLQDSEHSLTAWLLECSFDGSVKGAILEHAAHLLEARSHLSGSTKAINNTQAALFQIYDAAFFPLRRARTLANKLEMDVLSHLLLLSEGGVVQLESEALACLSQETLGQDEGLERFRPQYRCSLLLSAALHERLRQPFQNPQGVADKVELACKGLPSSLSASSQSGKLATSRATHPSPKAGAPVPNATPTTRGASRRQPSAASNKTTNSRKPLAQHTAVPQVTATPLADPKTPTSRGNKPVFDLAVSSQTRASPKSASGGAAHRLDRPEHFCRSLLTFHEAFSALSLTRCSVQILKVVRHVTRPNGEVMPGSEEIFCRASADLAQMYVGLGKANRAATVLHSSWGVLQRQTSPSSPSSQLVPSSQDVRFRCLMAQAELLSYERNVTGAQARFTEALKLARSPVKTDKFSSSSMERLRQRERQAIAFAICARLQMARGDLPSAVESTTLALRQLIRLSTNLTYIANRTQDSDEDAVRKVPADENVVNQESPTPSSDVVMPDAPDAQKRQEQHLPKFSGPTFSSLFWRCCGLLLDSYLRLSKLHSIRGSGLDAEALVGEGIDFATSLRFALPLARALIQRGELRLQLNQTEQGQEDLSRCLEILQETWIPEVIPLTCVQGDCLMRIEQLGEALRSYTAGEAILRSLSTAFADAEHAMATPKAPAHHRKKSNLESPTQSRTRLSNGISMELVMPETQSRLLQRQAWTLHLMGDQQRSEDTVEKAASVKGGLTTADARVDQFVLEGRIALRRALEHLKGDHFFSMLPEAAISIPMVPPVSVRTLVATAGSNQTISEETVQTALGMLTPADSAFREALSLGSLSSHSLTMREAFASLAQVYTTQAALGKNVKMAANAAAALIDWASSVGIRRSLLVSISAKLQGPHAALEEQEWPVLVKNEPQTHTSRRQLIEAGSDEEEADEEALPSRLAKMTLNNREQASQERAAASTNTLSAFWQSVRLRHQQSHHESGSAKHLLPRNWTVISISVRGTDVPNLVLTRQEGGAGADGCSAKEAVLYSLPMNRRSQRDGDEEDEEQLTLKAAQDKMEEIVRRSNDGIHGVGDIQSMEGRRQWWTERHRLDDELRDLVQAIQDTWLGGFKGVFCEPASDVRALAALRARFEKIIRRACFPTANKRPSKLKLDDAVFECFAGLPADCTDEDLEDLVHYVMDALQFSGFQVAVDEIDLDETAMDLRGALEEFHGKQAQASPNKANMAYVAVEDEEEVKDHHIFLVLDKETSVFPWESMPILRGRAVSRIPSMAFLQDRIEMAKVFCRRPWAELQDDDVDDLELSPLQKGKQAVRSRSRSPSKSTRAGKGTTLGTSTVAHTGTHDNIGDDSAWKVALRNGKLFSLSNRKTFYLLNPGGDLVQSQDRFEPWLKGRNTTRGWKGIVGRQPIVDELPEALSSSDLVLYFGHGGAEQFIRQTKVRELQRCAVTMLWGCSSALLHNNGEYDRTGTPLNYMVGGAPAMVGNLWDVTDRELDSVCEGVFGRLGLMEASERAQVKPAARNIKMDSQGKPKASRAPTEMSLARAVAESRDDCKLPYLTGAATVVYGVPVHWNQE